MTGVLSVANAYGTKRPSGGAFVSLDPGTGTSDTDVWIASKAKAYYTPSTASYNPADGVFTMTLPTQQYTVTDATYDPKSGVMVATIGNHTLDVGETIRIATESVSFTCSKDNYNCLLYTSPSPRDS